MFVYFDIGGMSAICLHESADIIYTTDFKNEQKITRFYYINIYFLIIQSTLNSILFVFQNILSSFKHLISSTLIPDTCL